MRKINLLAGFVAVALVSQIGTAMAAEHSVSQKGMKFTPSKLTIKPGNTVVFANNSTMTHNVYSRSGKNKFDTGALKPGASGKQTFAAAGSVRVRCAIHPKMKLKLTVK
jgi:plastocyanin